MFIMENIYNENKIDERKPVYHDWIYQELKNPQPFKGYR